MVVLLLAAAVAGALGAGTAEAKKRKTVRVNVPVSLLYIQSGGLDRFSGLVSSAFPRCAQFAQVLLTRETGSSAFGPFTAPIGLFAVDSGPSGTFQISYEPAFISPLTVHRYTVMTPERTFKARRKNVVCKAGVSPPVYAFQPAED